MKHAPLKINKRLEHWQVTGGKETADKMGYTRYWGAKQSSEEDARVRELEEIENAQNKAMEMKDERIIRSAEPPPRLMPRRKKGRPAKSKNSKTKKSKRQQEQRRQARERDDEINSI